MTARRYSVVRLVAPFVLAVTAFGCLTSCGTREPAPNIVLVVLDTVRRDHTGCVGSVEESATPFLDGFAAEATAFTRAWSNAPWTVPSHATMFTGLLPSVHGSFGSSMRLDTPAPTLAELLGGAGYETAAFYSNPWLSDEMTGMMRGFGTDRIAGDPSTMELLNRNDQGGRETLDNVRAWLSTRSSGRSFFMFVNFLEAHAPYDPPLDYRREHLADLPPDDAVTSAWHFEYHAGLHPPEGVDWRRVRRLYRGDVNTADRFLGALLDLLRERGLYEDCVVVVVSDHGEHLGEHGHLGHWYSVLEPVLAVPLVVRAPGLEPGSVRDDDVTLADVFPTVLEAAGIDLENGPARARSLLLGPSGAPRPVIAEYAGGLPGVIEHLKELNPSVDAEKLETAYATVRLGDLRLTLGSDGTESLHDLSRDPGQTSDLSGERPEAVEALYALLSSVHSSPDAPLVLDERMSEWLRSLGYLD